MATAAAAEDVAVAVAANAAAPVQALAELVRAATGHRLLLSIGSTGQLAAQIRAGAPFDVLLAADARTPARLEQDGFGVAGSRFTYASGRLVLWSRTPGLVDDHGEILRRGGFERLAIADPKLAPYGQAAIEVLQRLGLAEALRPRLVIGQSVAQAFQFVATGNAALGFVARSQVQGPGGAAPGSAWAVPAELHAPGSAWAVPAELHAPIRQDALLLARARDHAGAQALLRFLRGEDARALLRAWGYDA